MQNPPETAHKTAASALLEAFLTAAPASAARALEALPLNEAVHWAATLKTPGIILALENMTPKKAAVLLRRLPFKQAAHVVLGLNPAKAGELILALPPHYKKKLADNLAPSLLAALEAALTAPKGSALRAMGGNYLTFKTDAKIKDITAKIRASSRHKIPFEVYITDKNNRLAGVLKTAELALHAPEAAAGSVMAPAEAKIAPLTSEGAVLKIFKATGSPVLPVVDGDGFIIGTLSAANLAPAMPAAPKWQFWRK